jgi:hypothetical protein
MDLDRPRFEYINQRETFNLDVTNDFKTPEFIVRIGEEYEIESTECETGILKYIFTNPYGDHNGGPIYPGTKIVVEKNNLLCIFRNTLSDLPKRNCQITIIRNK